MPFRKRTLDQRIAVVVWSGPPSQLQKLDVQTGPCVPPRGGTKPLRHPYAQDRGETPELTGALFTALTGRPWNEALVLVGRAAPGRLSTFAPAFVDALADWTVEIGGVPDTKDAAGVDRFAEAVDDLARRWLQTGEWPSEVVSTRNRLPGRVGWVAKSIEKGHPVYAWHGPAV